MKGHDMTDPVPTIGRIVHYTLTEEDADTINTSRRTSTAKGNQVDAGDVYPLVITRVWGDQPDSAVNGQVLLDGNDVLWVTSTSVGAGPRHFAWPVRAVL